MADVLSQSQIDALLNAMQNSDNEDSVAEEPSTPEQEYRKYDFYSPKKYTEDKLKMLRSIYDNYARVAATQINGLFRVASEVEVVDVEEERYYEFGNALNETDVLALAHVELPDHSKNPPMVFHIAPTLMAAMIDRMLGGEGTPLEKSREFSEIELNIVEKLMVVSVQLLRDPWKNVIEIDPVLERLETNPQFAQVIAPNDMIAIVTLNLKIGDIEGFMNVCLPFFTLESIMDRLNTKYWFSNMQSDDETDYDGFIEALLRRVDVPVKAILGECSVSVNEFLELQIGDVIRLDTKVDSELNVYVGNIKKFTAMPGANDEHYAIQVTSVIREGE